MGHQQHIELYICIFILQRNKTQTKITISEYIFSCYKLRWQWSCFLWQAFINSQERQLCSELCTCSINPLPFPADKGQEDLNKEKNIGNGF